MKHPVDKAAMERARAFYIEKKDAAAQKSRKKNFESLWSVLEKMRAEGARAYDIAGIGRRLEEAGGMRTQSLRNKPAEDFRTLIKLYQSAVGDSISSVAEQSQADRAVALISDISVSAPLKQALAEARRLKADRDRLANLAKGIQIGGPEKRQGLADLTSLNQPSVIKRWMMDALKSGMREERLKERGLRIDSDGAIVQADGTKVFPPGFATAISEIIKQSGDNSG